MERGQWARTVAPKKQNMVRSPTCKFNNVARKPLKQQPCLNSQLKSPKCYIKITGSRYNGTFLLNIGDGLDDAIYHTMRDIEVALEAQTDPMGKPRVSAKNCLSSVFRCFGTNESQTKAVYNKKKLQKPVNEPASINKSDLGPLISAVQSNSFNPSPSPENSSESVMRDVVDVFRTTLDQFRRENMSSFEKPSPEFHIENNFPKHSTPTKISEIETVETGKQSQQELKKVSFIKFSQEEVLVIQPPKPINNGRKELEVGIEVKPKTTTSNVGQSIKLAKDKVLIGVQDGQGVLQINDGVPKRSLQMVIEEGVNGKPSMKLSLKEEKSEESDHLIPEHSHNNKMIGQENKQETPKNYTNSNYNENLSTMASSNGNTMDNSITHNEVKHYKSVESQVSSARLGEINAHCSERQKYKSEPTQNQISSSTDNPRNASHCACCTVEMKPQTTVLNAVKECSEESQDTALNFTCFKRYSDIPKTRDYRMPYLVHTLYEPRSLQNSSAYFASSNPSKHHSIDKASKGKKLETIRRDVKKRTSFSFSSGHSSSSKCTKIFRDIREIGVKSSSVSSLGKKDGGMATTLNEDFETILQNMCGSTYLYHHPEQPATKPDTQMKHHEQVLNAKKYFSDNLSFDQWTQTESCNQEVKACLSHATERRILKAKASKTRESGDGSHSRILRKKARQTKSTSSQRVDESSVSTCTIEDVLSSGSSEGDEHKVVFSMLTASDDSPLARTSSGLLGRNWITGKAKSFVGQKIFAAIEDHNNQSESFSDIKTSDSFVYPACKDPSELLRQGGNNVSVVNMALYDPAGPQLAHIAEYDPEEVKVMNEPVAMSSCNDMVKRELYAERNLNSTLQAATSHKRLFPIRVKSKSCQNLSITPSGLQAMENVEKGIICQSSHNKKLRYPHLTATDSRRRSALNVCGILNFHEGDIKADGQSLVSLEKLNPRLNQALPSAIRSLLLPKQQSLVLNNYDQMPTYCCDHFATKNVDYWGSGVLNQHENDWYTTKEEFDSVAIQRNLFKRTFFAMKTARTVVTRKFSTLFRKLSFTHSKNKKKDLAMTDSLVYVAIPLKKKSENIHLYPRAQ